MAVQQEILALMNPKESFVNHAEEHGILQDVLVIVASMEEIAVLGRVLDVNVEL